MLRQYRLIAAVSLGISALTLGLSPNASAVVDWVDEVAGQARLLDEVPTRSAVRDGQAYAREVIPGGSGRALAGHGQYRYNGTTVIPEGTTLTLWTEHGGRIPDDMGRAIENGGYAAIAANPDWAAVAERGAVTWLPGAEVPNYHLTAPDRLRIMSESITVEDATPLSDLLQPGMGHLDWAACLECR